MNNYVEILILITGWLIIFYATTAMKNMKISITIMHQSEKKEEVSNGQKTGVVHLTPEREASFAKGKKESEGDY